MLCCATLPCCLSEAFQFALHKLQSINTMITTRGNVGISKCMEEVLWYAASVMRGETNAPVATDPGASSGGSSLLSHGGDGERSIMPARNSDSCPFRTDGFLLSVAESRAKLCCCCARASALGASKPVTVATSSPGGATDACDRRVATGASLGEHRLRRERDALRKDTGCRCNA